MRPLAPTDIPLPQIADIVTLQDPEPHMADLAKRIYNGLPEHAKRELSSAITPRVEDRRFRTAAAYAIYLHGMEMIRTHQGRMRGGARTGCEPTAGTSA